MGRRPDMGKSGHESRLGHDFLTLKRLQKSRDQVVTRDHFAHVCPTGQNPVRCKNLCQIHFNPSKIMILLSKK